MFSYIAHSVSSLYVLPLQHFTAGEVSHSDCQWIKIQHCTVEMIITNCLSHLSFQMKLTQKKALQ